MKDGELPDWDRIVDGHAARVFRVAFRILGSVQDAEDVSQDAFAEVYRLHKEGSVQNWTALLVRLAALRSLDQLRRRRHRLSSQLREADRISAVEPSEEAEARELAAHLRQALGQLPDQQATVFVMHYFEQIPRDQIAAALGVSVEAISTALYKARRRLLDELAVFNRRGSQ
jgi:RNA polymerase sigma-70 factor (ECF subfamily)